MGLNSFFAIPQVKDESSLQKMEERAALARDNPLNQEGSCNICSRSPAEVEHFSPCPLVRRFET